MPNPLLFASDVSFETIGITITVLGVLVSLALNLKSLFWPSKPMEEETVRKQELKEVEDKIDAKFYEYKNNHSVILMSYVPRAEFQKLESRIEFLAQNYKELSEYSHKNIDDVLNKANQIALRIEALHHAIDKDRAGDRDKILEKIEQTSKDRSTHIDTLSNRISGLEFQVTELASREG